MLNRGPSGMQQERRLIHYGTGDLLGVVEHRRTLANHDMVDLAALVIAVQMQGPR